VREGRQGRTGNRSGHGGLSRWCGVLSSSQLCCWVVWSAALGRLLRIRAVRRAVAGCVILGSSRVCSRVAEVHPHRGGGEGSSPPE
jgi:hypothetical protein